jgi:uncharacterized protein YjbJ (UPF0337 family)
MTNNRSVTPETPRPSSQPHGTTEDQIREMESEGQGASEIPAVVNSEQAPFDSSARVEISALVTVRDNRPMENMMKPSTTDNAEGTLHEVKGAAKKLIGQVIGDADLAGEGDAEKIGGTVQKKIGQVEKVLGN